jgi:hypothetical protein
MNKVAETTRIKESLEEHLTEVRGIPRAAVPPGLMQVKAQYTTAVQVINPRNLEDVQRRCVEEARLAGSEFYYSWSQGGKAIEGLSVGAALAIARNFGNNAVDIRIDDSNPDAYNFIATFIDLETGYNLSRAKRQNKVSPKTKQGKDIYDGERGQDVVFEKGQSKAIRNVILNAVPSWLSKKVLDVAKKNVIKQMEDMGIEKAKHLIITKANALGINLERIEAEYSRERGWDSPMAVKIMSALRAIEDGQERAADLFPLAGDNINQAIPETTSPPPPQKQEPAPEPAPKQEIHKDFGVKLFNEYTDEISGAGIHGELTGIYNAVEKDLREGNITSAQHSGLMATLKRRSQELSKKTKQPQQKE